jgi:hypothetical protein
VPCEIFIWPGLVDMKHGEGNNTTVSHDHDHETRFQSSRLFRIRFVSLKSSLDLRYVEVMIDS